MRLSALTIFTSLVSLAIGGLIPCQSEVIGVALENVVSSVKHFRAFASEFLHSNTTYAEWHDREQLDSYEMAMYGAFENSTAVIRFSQVLNDSEAAIQTILPSLQRLREAIHYEVIPFQYFVTPASLEVKKWHAVDILRKQYSLFEDLMEAIAWKDIFGDWYVDEWFAIQSFLYATLAYLQPCLPSSDAPIKSLGIAKRNIIPRQASQIAEALDSIYFAVDNFNLQVSYFVNSNEPFDTYSNYSEILDSETTMGRAFSFNIDYILTSVEGTATTFDSIRAFVDTMRSLFMNQAVYFSIVPAAAMDQMQGHMVHVFDQQRNAMDSLFKELARKISDPHKLFEYDATIRIFVLDTLARFGQCPFANSGPANIAERDVDDAAMEDVSSVIISKRQDHPYTAARNASISILRDFTHQIDIFLDSNQSFVDYNDKETFLQYEQYMWEILDESNKTISSGNFTPNGVGTEALMPTLLELRNAVLSETRSMTLPDYLAALRKAGWEQNAVRILDRQLTTVGGLIATVSNYVVEVWMIMDEYWPVRAFLENAISEIGGCRPASERLEVDA